MVVTQVAEQVHGYLIDYHVSTHEDSADVAALQITGKPVTYALELHDALRERERLPGTVTAPVHNEKTEVQSMFYTMLDFDSDGAACLWRKADEKEMHCIKFITMFHPKEWEHALSYCSEQLRPLFRKLHQHIFPQFSPLLHQQHTFTFAQFLAVVSKYKEDLQGSQSATVVDAVLGLDVAASQQEDITTSTVAAMNLG